MTHPSIVCLDTWFATRLTSDVADWLRTQITAIKSGDSTALGLAFSSASRRAGDSVLNLNEAEKKSAHHAHPGWNPTAWPLSQAIRARLILAFPDHDAADWYHTIERLFSTASIEELVALYQTVPLMPFSELMRDRAAEGLRSSMQPVFAAVALDNPFPATQLHQDIFNQMVLKAFFTSADITRIYDLERRANHSLARMLCDYAQERRAASRSVDARLWQVVGWSADARIRPDLEKTLQHGSPDEQATVRSVLATTSFVDAAS